MVIPKNGTTLRVEEQEPIKVTRISENLFISLIEKKFIHFYITFSVKKEFSTEKSKNFSIKFLIEKKQPKVEYFICIQVYGITSIVFRSVIRLRGAFFYLS